MTEGLKTAIDKLKQLAKDNDYLCSKLESKKLRGTADIQLERLDNLMKTYRYWHQCCLIAAWLLEQESK